MTLFKTVVFFLSVLTFDAIALNSQMRVTTSQPTTSQNLDISVLSLSYLHSSKAILDYSELRWYPAINLSSLNVADENALSVGAAIGLQYTIVSKVNLFTEGGFTWLDQYQFGQRGVAYKNYGGHWQYLAKIGISYKLKKSWDFGYAYSHMSNGDRYRVNPALDAHSLYVTYQF